MKNIIVALNIMSFSETILYSQEYKQDTGSKPQKELNNNRFNPDITKHTK